MKQDSYKFVSCGGDNKERDTLLHDAAVAQTDKDMEEHPCGCQVCHANVLLFNLHNQRIRAGVDPYSGNEVA
jgi:hypothetical protein